VVAVGTNALRLASDRLPGVPLVYLMVLEASPAVRGAPASGVTLEIPAQAQIAALVALYPAMHRLGVLYDPAESGPAVERLQRAAASAGVTLVACAVSSTSEAMAAMSHLFAACDAYVVVPDRTTAGDSCFELAVLLSLRHHVPVFAPSRKFVEKGALAALETTYADVGEQAAEIARRMLAGGPAPAPEPPRVLGLCVNEKIARKLNVRIPERYLGHDVEVIP
jgi:putative ABC transport system substrate-binding protein